MQIPCGQVTKPTSNPVSDHCLADGPAHDKPHSRRLIDVGPDGQMSY